MVNTQNTINIMDTAVEGIVSIAKQQMAKIVEAKKIFICKV